MFAEDKRQKELLVLSLLRKSQAGFTLIEVVICITLIAIMSTISIVMSVQAIARHASAVEQTVLASALLTARSRAAFGTGQAWGLHLGPTEYVLFEGLQFDPLHPTNEVIARDARVSIAPLGDIVFEPGNAHVAAPLTFQVSTSGSVPRRIQVTTEGAIIW